MRKCSLNWTYFYFKMLTTVSKRRRIERGKDKCNDDVDDVDDVSADDNELQDEDDDLDTKYYRRVKEDRTKLSLALKRKSASITILDAPECNARDCPYCKLCLMQQRFKLMQLLRMIDTFLWGKLSHIEQLQQNPRVCLAGDCTASDCPFSRAGPLMRRRFICTQRLYQLNCTLWGEQKAKYMALDIQFDHDVLWSPV